MGKTISVQKILDDKGLAARKRLTPIVAAALCAPFALLIDPAWVALGAALLWCMLPFIPLHRRFTNWIIWKTVLEPAARMMLSSLDVDIQVFHEAVARTKRMHSTGKSDWRFLVWNFTVNRNLAIAINNGLVGHEAVRMCIEDAKAGKPQSDELKEQMRYWRHALQLAQAFGVPTLKRLNRYIICREAQAILPNWQPFETFIYVSEYDRLEERIAAQVENTLRGLKEQMLSKLLAVGPFHYSYVLLYFVGIGGDVRECRLWNVSEAGNHALLAFQAAHTEREELIGKLLQWHYHSKLEYDRHFSRRIENLWAPTALYSWGLNWGSHSGAPALSDSVWQDDGPNYLGLLRSKEMAFTDALNWLNGQ